VSLRETLASWSRDVLAERWLALERTHKEMRRIGKVLRQSVKNKWKIRAKAVEDEYEGGGPNYRNGGTCLTNARIGDSWNQK
jgi:hypothetical protein